MLLLLGCPEAAPPADPKGDAPGVLELAFLDARSDAPTPVRVQVLDEEGLAHFAQDALRVGGHCFDTPTPLSLERAHSVRRRRIRHRHTGTWQFYAAGRARLVLPPGAYRLEASKGFEYDVQRREYRVAAGETIRDAIAMTRWIDLPAEGWYGADGHLHIARPAREADAPLVSWMQAEDIHVANLLQWGTFRRFHNAVQYAFGEEGVHREGDTLLVAGQENPRTHFLGHAVILGAPEPIHYPDSYLVYQDFFREARRREALSGYAHLGVAFEARNGIRIDLAHDLLDFLEVRAFGLVDYSVWYEILDAGFRLVPTGGSDYPCGFLLPGAERFFTQVVGELTLASWLDGVRAGRTFATNGPLLRFRVEDKGMGEVLELEGGRALAIEGDVRFDPERDRVQQLRLVVNGATVKQFFPDPGARSIAFRHELLVDEPGWIALRASGTKPGLVHPEGSERGRPVASEAHSAPVYVEVAGRPGLARTPRAREIRRRWIARLSDLAARLDDAQLGALHDTNPRGGVTQDYIERNRPLLLEAIRAAQDRHRAAAQ